MIETSAPPRFTFNLPPSSSPGPRRLRTVWISDVHLGTRSSSVPMLLDFLREHDFEMLYIVGRSLISSGAASAAVGSDKCGCMKKKKKRLEKKQETSPVRQL